MGCRQTPVWLGGHYRGGGVQTDTCVVGETIEGGGWEWVIFGMMHTCFQGVVRVTI